jgi:hypothetical protein
MFKRLFLVIFLLIGASQFLFSQITISSPVLRQVFQRDISSKAVVTITGSYSQPIDTLQARFTAVQAGQGTNIDWTVIKSSPLGGLFKGSVVVKGGWYRMEVRGLLNGKQVGNISTIERVGVGEVFVIAGQSNAGGTGERAINETAASDDRVNCANFINATDSYWKGYDPTNPSFKIAANTYNFSIVDFSQLKKASSIGPMGLGPFYWGKVGDALAAKLNVPIMFFNVAFAGSSVRVWKESAENPTIGVIADTQFDSSIINRYDVGTPYANLKEVLGFYGVNLGVRAVLWMQGETENVIILRDKPNLITYEAQYQANLEALIKKTRQDFGNNKLAWVIARTSYSGQLGCGSSNTNLVQTPSPIVVSGQNKVISNALNAPIYPGPFTDNIQIPRENTGKAECVHFTKTGLDDVANAWIKSLTEDNKNFFETVEPILADTIPSISLECVSSSQLKLSLPGGYSAYEWVNTDNGLVVGKNNTVNVGSGTFIARVTRTNGNIVQIPRFTVKTNTPPKAPVVTATSDVNFCLGTSVLLQSSTEAENPIYEWISTPVISNLPRTKDISASREATYKLRVIDKNACASPYSTDVKLVAKPRPEKPLISTSGSTVFCDGESVTLTSSNVGTTSFLWSNGEKTQAIAVKKGGTYNVQTIGSNGCLSLNSTDNINVVVNPLPAAPQIRALADTVFCDGGSVSLVSTPTDNSTKFGWERNGKPSTDNSSTIKVSGTELVRGFVVNNNNCNSKTSNAIQVVKKDNPSVLTVIQKGTFVLEAISDKPAQKYVWKSNGKVIPLEDSSSINTRKYEEGAYSVSGKNIYKVRSSPNDLICLSPESNSLIYSFQISENKGFSVYPNPSNGSFLIERLYSFKDADEISIYSIDGKFMYKKTFNNFILPQTLDLSFLGEGVYILRSEKAGLSKLLHIVR